MVCQEDQDLLDLQDTASSVTHSPCRPTARDRRRAVKQPPNPTTQQQQHCCQNVIIHCLQVLFCREKVLAFDNLRCSNNNLITYCPSVTKKCYYVVASCFNVYKIIKKDWCDTASIISLVNSLIYHFYLFTSSSLIANCDHCLEIMCILYVRFKYFCNNISYFNKYMPKSIY